MPKLHELLAATGPLTAQANKTKAELENTFDKKRTHFEKRIATFTPVEEGAQPVVEEQLDLQTTVKKELDWIGNILAGAIDTAYQVDLGNTQAKANIELADGKILAKDVPATALLQLEKRTAELLHLVTKIPTMDPSKGFAPDSTLGEGIYKSREEVKTRTKKVQRPIVLYDATPNHPAQTQLISEDIVAGKLSTVAWSGLLTTAAKGDMLERVEKLSVAIKKARARANEQLVEPKKIAETLLGYVFSGQA